jgi:hypothetical protein
MRFARKRYESETLFSAIIPIFSQSLWSFNTDLKFLDETLLYASLIQEL